MKSLRGTIVLALCAAGGPVLAACSHGSSNDVEAMPPGSAVMMDGGFDFIRPQYGPTRSLDEAPPPITGGTLAITNDGKIAIAGDPDRGAVDLVDLASIAVKAHVALQHG